MAGNAGNQASLNTLNETKNEFVRAAELAVVRAEGRRREVVGLRLVVDATTLEISRLTEAILRLQQPGAPEPMLEERLAIMNQLKEGHQARLPILAEEIATATAAAEAFDAASDAAQQSAEETRVLITECLNSMGM